MKSPSPPVRPVPTSPEALRVCAGWVIEVLRQSSGLKLEYDADSVLQLDQWIDKHRLEVSPQGVEYMGVLFGAFLGECMRRNLGGAWEEKDGDWGMRLPARGPAEKVQGSVMFPLRKARRHMLEGESQSIATMYILASALCETHLDPEDPRFELRREFLEQIDRALEERRQEGDQKGTGPVQVTLPRVSVGPAVTQEAPPLRRLGARPSRR